MNDLLTSFSSILTLITVFMTLWHEDIEKVKNIIVDKESKKQMAEENKSLIASVTKKILLMFCFCCFSLVIYFLSILHILYGIRDGVQYDGNITSIKLSCVFAYIYNLVLFGLLCKDIWNIYKKKRELK